MGLEMREYIDKFRNFSSKNYEKKPHFNKNVRLNENFNKKNGVIISDSYTLKNGLNIHPNNKQWKNKLPKVDGVYLLHNTFESNLNSILSDGFKFRLLGVNGELDSYFRSDIISHKGGNTSIIVIFKQDEYYKLSTGVWEGVKYNIYIKDGVIPPERILGYIHIPNTSEGSHDERLIFYPNDKFNLKVKLNIVKENVTDDTSDEDGYGTRGEPITYGGGDPYWD